MNSGQAKKIDLPRFLLKLGFEPVKIVKEGAEFWYNSPFRTEKPPPSTLKHTSQMLALRINYMPKWPT